MRVPSPRVVLTFAALSVTATVVASCNRSEPAPAPESTTEDASSRTAESQIRRGELLIIGGGCHDCHTPKTMTSKGPEADMSKMLSGHPESQAITAPFKGDGGPWTTHVNDHLTAWSGAWGVSFAANLTPDQNTGIGIWTEEMFVNALKTGKHMGTSRQILPPMPWNYYGQLPDEDLKAMYAYLKSIPAVSNRVPVPLTPDGKPIEEP